MWEHELLRPAALWRHDHDVFHNLNLHAPLFRTRPWVQTLYDAVPLLFDDPRLKAERRRMGQYGPRYAKADAVVAISRSSADEGMRMFGIDPARITVVPLGASPQFHPNGSTQTDPPYISVVSEYQQRKGFPEAFAVIAALAEAGYPHRLRVAGRIPPWLRAELEALRQSAARPDRIDLLGFVEDLPAHYRGATVHLVPSRHEGFGLPAVEAMACGTPVVAFRNSSLIELLDGAGLVVTDGDVPAMAAAVRGLVDDPRRRAELAEAGLIKAAGYTWEACASAHVELYQALAR
jgi:alpha-1,3-rhamnosyl/mannosyltransferase